MLRAGVKPGRAIEISGIVYGGNRATSKRKPGSAFSSDPGHSIKMGLCEIPWHQTLRARDFVTPTLLLLRALCSLPARPADAEATTISLNKPAERGELRQFRRTQRRRRELSLSGCISGGRGGLGLTVLLAPAGVLRITARAILDAGAVSVGSGGRGDLGVNRGTPGKETLRQGGGVGGIAGSGAGEELDDDGRWHPGCERIGD